MFNTSLEVREIIPPHAGLRTEKIPVTSRVSRRAGIDNENRRRRSTKNRAEPAENSFARQ